MERNKKGITIAVVALIVAVASIGIAFATLTQGLSIGGTAVIKQGDWDVKFVAGSLGTVVLTGDAVEINNPTLGLTNITDINVTFKNQNDSASYNFSVTNAGTINARLGSITAPSVVCSAEGMSEATQDDMDEVCAGFEYEITDLATNAPVAVNQDLDAGATKALRLTLKYTGTYAPTDDVTVTFNGLTLTYVSK